MVKTSTEKNCSRAFILSILAVLLALAGIYPHAAASLREVLPVAQASETHR